MNDKQKRLLEWLKKLELFAQNENLPMRLIDSIRDLREQAAVENTDWYQLYINADNLFQSIGHKVQKQQTSQEITTDYEVISVDEVKKKISEILTRGRNENAASISDALYGSRVPIKECYRQINEIASNRRTLTKIGNGNYFLNLFQKIKQSYERNIRQIFNDFATSVSNNCMRMIENIRSICKGIDGYKLGFGEEEFYVKYNERKEGWDSQLRYNIENADLGSHVIMDFAQETLEKMRQTASKYKKKRNFQLGLSCLILLIGIVLVGGFSLANKYMEGRNKQIETEAAQSVSSNIVSDIESVMVTVSDLESVKGSVTSKKSNIKILYALIVIVIIALCFIYTVVVMIFYHNKIISAFGECLQRESELFEKENRLDFHVEFEEIVSEYEQYYINAINGIFEGSTLEHYVAKKQSEYDQLRNEWDIIQRM